MRRLAVLALLALSLVTFASSAQPVAKVQMPCESKDQTLSPTGAQLVVVCADHSMQLVSVAGGNQRELLPADRRPSAYVYSADGKWLALGFADGAVQVVSSDGGTTAKQWKAAGNRRIDLLYFSPDGKFLVVAPVDRPGEVWDLTATPAQRGTLPADFGGMSAVAASPDGKRLVTAGGDTVLRIYDTANWQKVREQRDFLLDTFALQFTPDGKQLLAGGADSRISVLDPATGKIVRQMAPEAGSFIIAIDLLGGTGRASTLYADNAGEKPPHALMWDIAAGKSAPIKFDAMPTCGGVVKDKLWLCTVEGKTLTITQQE
jgi:WD40 repeat protein